MVGIAVKESCARLANGCSQIPPEFNAGKDVRLFLYVSNYFNIIMIVAERLSRYLKLRYFATRMPGT
jgi:hypothetical protein